MSLTAFAGAAIQKPPMSNILSQINSPDEEVRHAFLKSIILFGILMGLLFLSPFISDVCGAVAFSNDTG
jgi:hypothetical protein